MSFIYDNDKLLNELIKSAVDHEMKFNKHGQLAADPSVNVEFRNYLSLTKKLAQQLKDKYFPKAADSAVVATATGKDAPMGVPDLASLGNFLDFIVNNQITVDGKRVAYGAGEQNPDPRQYLPVTAEQIKFMMETVTPQGDRTQFQADYYVSKDLLVKYVISMLRENSKQDEATQRFTKAMLGARLEDINRVFKTKLTTDYKEPEKVLPDTTPLDNLPKDLDPQTWYNPGDIPLTIGDVKSPMNLNNWLSSHSISIKSGDRRMMINHPEFDRCAIVKILVSRAKYNADRAANQDAAARAAIYDKSVRAIAEAIKCDLGETKPDPNKEKPGQEQGGGAGQINPQALMELSTLRPFNSDVINFREIKLFVDRYAKLANRPNLTQMAQQINASITDAKGNMNVQNDQIMIGMLVDSNDLNPLKALTRLPVPFMDKLYTVMYSAGSMYQDFYNTAKYQSESNNGRIPDNIVNSIAQQVSEGGPWSTNMADINQMREDLQKEIKERGR